MLLPTGALNCLVAITINDYFETYISKVQCAIESLFKFKNNKLWCCKSTTRCGGKSTTMQA